MTCGRFISPFIPYMTEAEKKAVEASNAAAEAAKNSAAAAETEKDRLHAAKVKELEEKLAKETRDKENYRAGLLSKKELDKKNRRLTAEDLADPVKVEEAMEAKIQEAALEAKVSTDVEAEANARKKLETELEETKRALEAAKTSGGGAGGGAGIQENSASKPQGYFSDVQKAELRRIYTSHGLYTPDMIEKMIVRAEEIAKQKAGSESRVNDLVPKRTN